MTNVLEELYYGNLYPNEQIVPDSKEYGRFKRRLYHIVISFDTVLDQLDRKLMYRIGSTIVSVSNMVHSNAFGHVQHSLQMFYNYIYFRVYNREISNNT